MKPILEIKGISKKYRIRSTIKPYLSLRESLTTLLKPSSKSEDFWALHDISFDVMPGDTVGIIGKNGAGKSTLLKILSKITPPTKGNIISRGRIASLLEVGTGFHPELSGRENIFLNGSILGMKKAEIKKQFDAILDFSGVEKFIETPLKHYSSGMQLRLAFAVAAFLEPEILIIDEVLAVGDAEFQKKCINKMNDVSQSGRTILFVSHNMGVLESLCSRSILLDHGSLQMQGSSAEVIKRYISSFSVPSKMGVIKNKKDAGIQQVYFSGKNEVKTFFDPDEDIIVNIIWENKNNVKVNVNIEVLNLFGTKIFFSIDTVSDQTGSLKSEAGLYESSVMIPGSLLNIGQYVVHVGLDCAMPQLNFDAYLNSCYFSVIDNADYSKKLKGDFVGIDTSQHAIQPLLNWSYKKLS